MRSCNQILQSLLSACEATSLLAEARAVGMDIVDDSVLGTREQFYELERRMLGRPSDLQRGLFDDSKATGE